MSPGSTHQAASTRKKGQFAVPQATELRNTSRTYESNSPKWVGTE